MLENAEVGQASSDGTVTKGALITAIIAGKEQVFVLGNQEIAADVPDGARVFSPEAPLGKALMGHKAGETVSYKAPNGRVLRGHHQVCTAAMSYAAATRAGWA